MLSVKDRARLPQGRKTVGSGEGAEHDLVLISRFSNGDEDAFVEIMRRYHPRMKQQAMSLIGIEQDADEIVQDAFISAYKNLPKFKGDSSLSAWLLCIVVRLARDRSWWMILFDQPGHAHKVSLHEFASMLFGLRV